MKLENIVHQKRIRSEWFKTVEERVKLQERCERQSARDLVHDVLYSGFITTHSTIDPATGDLSVMAEMFVGVRGGEDVNDMLMNQRDYDKYHKQEDDDSELLSTDE